MKLHVHHEEIDFTPVDLKIEKELNFAQTFGIATVVIVFLLFIGNLVIGLD